MKAEGRGERKACEGKDEKMKTVLVVKQTAYAARGRKL